MQIATFTVVVESEEEKFENPESPDIHKAIIKLQTGDFTCKIENATNKQTKAS